MESFPLQYWFPTTLDTSFSDANAPPAAPAVLDISLNTLAINVNHQTIASLLEMLQSIGARIDELHPRPVQVVDDGDTQSSSSHDDDQERKFKITAHVAKIKITLAKETHSIAEILVSDVYARVCSTSFHLDAFVLINFFNKADRMQACEAFQGLLGSLSIKDLTPAGLMYSHPFMTLGERALVLKFFRTLQSPHERSAEADERSCMYFNMCMSSVQYVHTRRFMTMLIAYINHFQHSQLLVKKFQAAAAGVIAHVERNSSFLQLDITIDNPYIIIPRNSFSCDYFHCDLGSLRVTNALVVCDS